MKQTRPIPLTSRAVEPLWEAAAVLRRQHESLRTTVSGIILRLGTLPDGTPHGITLEGVVDDVRRHIRAVLSTDNYTAACDAHKYNQTVSLTGVLHKEPRRYVLTDISDFKVLE